MISETEQLREDLDNCVVSLASADYWRTRYAAEAERLRKALDGLLTAFGEQDGSAASDARLLEAYNAAVAAVSENFDSPDKGAT